MKQYMNWLNLPDQRIEIPDFVDINSDGGEEEVVRKGLMDRTTNAQLNSTDDNEIGVLCESDTLEKLTILLKIWMKKRKLTFKENTLPLSHCSLTTDK